MRRCTLFLVFTSLFLFSCRSVDSFTHRKYLEGVFREQKSVSENIFTNRSVQPTNIQVLTEFGAQERQVVVVAISETQKTVACEPQSLELTSEEISAAQPEDTITKSKKELRREYRRTDKFRSRISFAWGIQSIIGAVLFTLVGLWLGGGGARNFSSGILLLFVLIVIIIPIYISLGVGSLLNAIFSIVLAGKVRSKHKGEETYEGEKATRMGIIFSILGLIALTIGAILTLPHFLNW